MRKVGVKKRAWELERRNEINRIREKVIRRRILSNEEKII